MTDIERLTWLLENTTPRQDNANGVRVMSDPVFTAWAGLYWPAAPGKEANLDVLWNAAKGIVFG